MIHHIVDQHCKDVAIKFKDWYMEKVFATPVGELLNDDDAMYEWFLRDNPSIHAIAKYNQPILTKDHRL